MRPGGWRVFGPAGVLLALASLIGLLVVQRLHINRLEDHLNTLVSAGAVSEFRRTSPWFCPREVSDQARWKARERRIQHGPGKTGDATGADPRAQAEMRRPIWYCDKLPWNLDPWPARPGLPKEQLVLAVASGANIIHSRAAAARDTWLNPLVGFPMALIFGEQADPSIPIETIDHWLVTGSQPGKRRDPSVAFYLLGLAIAYRRHPDRAWYTAAGDDNYLHPDYTMMMLADASAAYGTEPVFLAQWFGQWTRGLNTGSMAGFDRWPNGPAVRKSASFSYSSGSIPYYLNNAAAALMAQHIDEFIDVTFGETNLCVNCPDVYQGLLMELLGIKSVPFPKKWQGSAHSYAVDHVDIISHRQFFSFHYVSPRKMLALHQRAVHEKLDRMINSGSLQAVEEMMRHFIDHHFWVLRKRQQEVLALATKAGINTRGYDIPDPVRFASNHGKSQSSPQRDELMFGSSWPPLYEDNKD